MLRILSAITAAGLLATPVLASDDPMKTIRKAEVVLTQSVSAPDAGVPRELLEKAECIGIFPSVAKGAFIVGGQGGHGVFTCRQPDGEMGSPAFFSIGGPSVGWQFGGSSTDLVLLVMNNEGMKHLLEDKFTIGGEAAAVAGPVGRSAHAQTDAQLHAQILSWSRSRGAFLGASLEGTVLKPDDDMTEEFYGRNVAARDILIKHTVELPAAARSFIAKTSEYARGS